MCKLNTEILVLKQKHDLTFNFAGVSLYKNAINVPVCMLFFLAARCVPWLFAFFAITRRSRAIVSINASLVVSVDTLDPNKTNCEYGGQESMW